MNINKKMFKSTANITCICGSSGHGKTTLSKSLNKNAKYISCYDSDPLAVYKFLEDISSLFNYRTDYTFKLLTLADPRIECLIKPKNNSDDIDDILFKKFNDDTEYTISEIKPSKKYLNLLLILTIIRNNKNVIIDDLDSLFTGSSFSHVIKFILREAEINNTNLTVTFTDINIWQLFCLTIRKEIKKKFIFTKYHIENGEFSNLELNYNQLAYTVSMIYDSNLKKSLSEEEDNKIKYFPLECKNY